MNKALCKLPTIAAVNLLDYVFTSGCTTKQNIKHYKPISGLVDCILHSLATAANEVVDLTDLKDEIEEAMGLKFSTPNILSRRVVKEQHFQLV